MLKHLNQHHSQEIARKKLYKSGKLWVTATIASFFLIAPMQRANADQNTDQSQNQKTATTSQQTSTQTARTDQAAAKTTDAQSTSENQNNSQQTAATTGTNQTTQTAQSGQSTQDSQNQNKTTNSQNVLSNRVGDDNSQSSDSQSAIRTDINNLQTDIHQLVQEAQQLGLSATEQPVQEASAFDAEKIRTDLTNTKQQLQDQIAKKKAYNDQQAQYQSDLTKYNQEKEAVDARNAAAQQTYNEQVAAREQAIANAAGEHHAKQTFNLDVKGGPWIFGNYWHGTVDYDITYHWDNDKRTFIITNRAFKYNPVADTSEQAQGTGFADAFYVGSPTAQKPADWTPSTSDRGQQDLILNTISGQDVYNRIKNQVPYLGVYIAHNNKTYDTFMSPQPAADGWIHEDLSSDPYEAVQQADGKYDIAHIMTRKLDFVDYPEHDYWDLAKTLIDDPGIPVTPTEPTKEQYPAAPTAPTAPTFTAVNYQPVQFNDLTVGPNNPQTPGQPIDPNNPNGPKWPAEAGQDAVRKTIQRTVEYQDAKSQQSIAPTVTQSVIYGRTVVIDKATGRVEGYSKDGGSQVDYSPEQGDQAWQSDHPQWDAVTSPDLTQKGYGQPDRATVAAEQVAVTTADDHQVVRYNHATTPVNPDNPQTPGQPINPNNPNGPKWPAEAGQSAVQKTITRTIDYVNGQNGAQMAQPVQQQVVYGRTVIIDKATGQALGYDTNGDGQVDLSLSQGDQAWTSQNNQYGAVQSPVINGYYADQATVAAETVAANDSDKTVKVTYLPMGHLVPDVPGNNPVIYPNNPTDPTQPTNPVIPNIPGYTPTNGNGQPVKPGDQYPIDPKQPGKDTPIHYVKDLQAKVTYIDQNDGKTLHEDALTVPYQGSSDYKTANQIASLEKQGYELVSDNFPADGLHYQKQGQQSDYQVVLKHKDKTVDPNNPGQPGQPIDPNNPDGPKYPDGTDKSSLEKTITRTIDYVDGNGKQVAPSKTETVTYDRTATVDEVTGKVTYSDWTPKDGQNSYSTVKSPVVNGYYADRNQVDGKTVGVNDQDETVKVTYQPMGHLVPDVPGNNPVIYPNNPSDPTQPGNPVIPNIPAYTPTDGNGQPVKPGDQYPIDPKQPGKDTPIHYVKDLQAKVTYIDQNDGKTLHEDSLTVPYQGSS
ncbi:KxYKxGKxW signal peptide domain-containing protein, partial [Leuconostocaceae bacterium ESL0958]|nr:KxYKxGKxW signal peptide domain-containing protein [Leuconostocaceae bacterium ESL0958]